MITLMIKEPHECYDPYLDPSTWNCADGSLWECDDCGREWIKTGVSIRGDVWEPTVTIIAKESKWAS